jgi:Domain of unknown function (DUF6894)
MTVAAKVAEIAQLHGRDSVGLRAGVPALNGSVPLRPISPYISSTRNLRHHQTVTPDVMPVYHFNLMAGVTRVLDPRGTYLPDDDAARRYAKQLVRAQLVQGPQWSIEVITENGDFVDMVAPL